MRLITILFTAFLFFNANLCTAQCNEGEELILNGSFEMNFFNWNLTECLPGGDYSLGVNTSTYGIWNITSIDGFTVGINNIAGGSAPCTLSMCQTVTIPASAASATLSWYEFIEGALQLSATQDKVHEVNIVDPVTGVVIENLHTVNLVAGVSTFGQTGWQNYSIDVSSYVGQTIDVCFQEFVPETVGDPAVVMYDSISLLVGCAPVETVPTLSEWGLILLSILLMTYGTLVIGNSNTTLSGVSNIQIPVSKTSLPFSKKYLNTSFAITAFFVLIGFAISIILYGRIFASDVIGVSFTAPAFIYLVHLLLIQQSESSK